MLVLDIHSSPASNLDVCLLEAAEIELEASHAVGRPWLEQNS